MDSEAGGKAKGKRSRTQDKPYGRKTSLLNRMKDSMKDMLSPSWLVDIVSSVKKISPNQALAGQNNAGVPTRPTTHDTASASYLSTLPQMSFQQSSTPVAPAGLIPNPNFSDNRRHAMQPHVYGRQPLNSGNRYSAPSINETPIAVNRTNLSYPYFKNGGRSTPTENGDDNGSESSDVSTSVVSSIIPQPDKRDYQKEILKLDDRKLEQLGEELAPIDPEEERVPNDSRANSSHMLNKSKSLWSDESVISSRPQPQSSFTSHPSFNVSVFGSPSFAEKSSFLSENYKQSPFYPGKTTFGGASSLRKTRLSAAAPYQASPARRQVKVKQLENVSRSSASTSSTAKRILDTLEKMATPLADAKKIPSHQSSGSDSILSFTPSSYRRKPAYLRKSSEMSSLSGPPVSRLNTPRPVSIGRHRVATASRSSPTLNEGANLEAQKTTESMSTGPSGKTGGKMKREKSSHYSSKKADEEEEVEVPDLPTGVTLNVGSMASFSFGTFSAPKTSTPSNESQAKKLSGTSSAVTLPSQKKEVVEMDVAEAKSDDNMFRFSSPIKKQSLGKEDLSLTAQQTFTFTSPVDVSKTTAKPKPKVQEPPAEVGLKPATQLKTGSVMDILGAKQSTQSPTTPMFGGVKAASELKTGSVMDILGGAKPKPPGGPKPATELKTGSVMDILGKSSSTEEKTTSVSNLFGKKDPVASWECDCCMIVNKPDVASCVACQSKKPAAASSKPTAPSSGMAFSKPAVSSTWECDTCMIFNKTEDTVCVACQTMKPGAVPPASSSTKSLFTVPPTSKPTQVNKSSGPWECDTCLVNNKAEMTRCIACETPRPGHEGVVAPPKPSSTPTATMSFGEGGGFKFSGTSDSTKTSSPFAFKPTTDDNPTKGGFVFKAKTDAFKPTTDDNPPKGGFVFKAKSDDVSSGGSGFQFKPNVETQSSASSENVGFQFKPVQDSKSEGGADSKTASGGFQFKALSSGSDSSSSSQSQTGFTFKPADSASTTPATGGFTFGGSVVKTEETKTKVSESTIPVSTTGSAGFTFGNNDGVKNNSKPITFVEPPAKVNSGTVSGAPLNVGQSKDNENTEQTVKPVFSFGAPVAKPDNSPKLETKPSFSFGSKSSENISETRANSGFTFGSTNSVQATQEQPKAPFAFGATSSTSATTTSNSLFTFGSGNKTEEPPAQKPVFGAAVEASSKAPATAGFAFGAQATTVSAAPASTAFSMPGASPFGNLAGQTPKTNQEPAAKPSFNFGQAPQLSSGSVPNMFSSTPNQSSTTAGFGQSQSGVAKRSLDSDTGPDAKKAAAPFGSGNMPGFAANSPFGAPTTSSSVPAFGSPSPSIFGSQSFGASSTQQPSSVFGGMPSSTSVFGAQSTQPAFGTPSGSTFSAPSTGTPFGSASVPAFGANASTAPSQAPVFGAPTPTAAPAAFNLNPSTGFNFGSSTASTSSTGGVFAFGSNQSSSVPSKPAETGGFNFSAVPNTNFGAPATGGFSAPPNFSAGTVQFNATPDAGNPFNAAPSTGGQRRVIKKASRKLNRR